MTNQADVIDTEPTTPERALELRRPDIPTDLNELAAQKSAALEIIETRALVLSTLRKAAILATYPEDWLLFKAPDEQGGQIVAYLQDCGGDRVRPLFGIEIFHVTKPEKHETNDPAVFHYFIQGDGRCKITREEIENVEGGRSSTDDFCKGKNGLELELAVRKAARANLDGNITRELSGLKSVPIEQLQLAWANTTKKVENCRRGRGFGTRDERLGARSEKVPDVDPPVCPHCGATGIFRPAKGDRKAFYGCPKWEEHKAKKFIEDAEKWVAKQQQKKAAEPATTTTQPATATATAPAGKVTPPSAEEVFSNNKSGGREPGQEG